MIYWIPEFFNSRIHPDDQTKDIFKVSPNKECWEHSFRFKKPPGEYHKTRISFQLSKGGTIWLHGNSSFD